MTVGDCESIDDPAYGNIAELVVHSASDVDFVAARIAREGGQIIFEDHKQNALQGIGIERLDRIEAKVCKRDLEDDRTDAEEFGLGRGDENWIFPWLPKEWSRVPITWDYMVENMAHVQDVSKIPLPLRQHVAKVRYDACKDKDSDAAKALRAHVFKANGEPRRRVVSAGLSKPQSVQVIEAFYLLTVERVTTPRSPRGVPHTLPLHAAPRLHGSLDGQVPAGRIFRQRRGDESSIDCPSTTHRLPTVVLNKLVARSGIVKGEGTRALAPST